MVKKTRSMEKDMSKQIFDVAVIGAGPSGLFATFQAGLLGLNVVVIETLPQAGGQLSALYPEKIILDVPGFLNIGAGELSHILYEQAQKFSPKWHFNTQVQQLSYQDSLWHLQTSDDQIIQTKAIIIAAGGGSFAPKRPPHIENIQEFENISVFYSVQNPNEYIGKNVTIIGGGDSAVDWAMQLTKLGAYVTLVHRRDKFRALPAHVSEVENFAQQGKLNLQTGKQLHQIAGNNGQLTNVEIADLDGNIEQVPAEFLLIFMGLNKDLGPISQWGLSESKTRIPVDPITMQTSMEGIFAIGDIAHWEGKIPLIVTGFGEAAIAARGAFLVARPDEKLSKIHSTSMTVN